MLTVIDRLLNQFRPSRPTQGPAPAPLPKAPRHRRIARRFACPVCRRVVAHTAAGVPYLHRCTVPASVESVFDAAGPESSIVPPWGDTEAVR